MKKLLITIILLTVCSVHAQTDEKETLKQINQNANSAYQNQKLDDAIKFAQQAVDLSLKIYGAKNVETAVAYTNLGVIYRDKKKFRESIENLQTAVDIYQKTSDIKNQEIIVAYQTLAYSQLLNGKGKEAEASYLKSVEVAENLFGKDSREVIKPIMETAAFYSKTSDYEKSQEQYLKTYALVIKHFGRESDEMENVKIYSSYYAGGETVWTNDKRYKEYKVKFDKLFGYERGDATSLPKPAYPAEAIKKGKQGKIVVRVWVDEKGNVTDAKAVYGEMAFASVAEEATRKARFKPSLKDGKPIGAINYITYKFVK